MIRQKMQVFEPQKQKCLDELIQRYEDVADFELKRNKQSRVTRCILKMARRIQLHVEMKAKSPQVFCDTFKTKERYEKFYDYFVNLDDEEDNVVDEDPEENEVELDNEENNKSFRVPRFECPFLRD